MQEETEDWERKGCAEIAWIPSNRIRRVIKPDPTKSQPQENLSHLLTYIFIACLLPKWVLDSCVQAIFQARPLLLPEKGWGMPIRLSHSNTRL